MSKGNSNLKQYHVNWAKKGLFALKIVHKLKEQRLKKW